MNLLSSSFSSLKHFKRMMSSTTKKALVLGIQKSPGNDSSTEKKEIKLSPFSLKVNEQSKGELLSSIKSAFCDNLSSGKTRILFNDKITGFNCVAVTSIDPTKFNRFDEINDVNESIRIATSSAVKALQAVSEINEIHVECMGNGSAAAEGAILANYKYQSYKSKKSELPTILCAEGNDQGWIKGAISAEAQNFCKLLMETPANLMTPSVFCETAKEKFAGIQNVELVVHDENWARKEKMELYLSVSAGSSEPPKFLEIIYNGNPKSLKSVAFVGKGITFDSGGISLKPSAKMDQMRADMGGAANVASSIWAIAKLKANINVRGFIPLCENMPGNKATKPGDVIVGRNGKSVCIDNTDAEGRLILADALSYASDSKPAWILDIATLTGAVRVALGDCVTGIYSTNDELWKSIHAAGSESGDRVWRMPLFSHYGSQMTEHDGYDLNNLGKGKGGGSCTAAAFLKEFVPDDIDWIHADIAGVMCETSDQSYIGSSMTGRPVRTLIELLLKEADKNMN